MSDVKEKALWLLQFIEDSLQEAIKHPHTLEDCLTEAGCALRILDKHVRSDDRLNALFSVSPLCGFRFLDSFNRKTHTEQMELVEKALVFVAATQDLIRFQL